MNDFIDKIIAIFDANKEKEQRDAIWQWCYDHIKEVPLNEDSLDDMANNNITWGVFGGRAGFRSNQLMHDIDALMRLAEATGVRAVSNPEGGINPPAANHRILTFNELLSEIEAKIGFQITLPSFIGGCREISTNRGILTDRHCHYLWVMKRIIDLFPDRNTPIIEIGAGIGLLGYYLDRAGYKDYTIIDLAHANLIQSYFLYKNMPDRHYVFSTVQEDPYCLAFKDSIKILHASDFLNIPVLRFDLMINIDGLTEMGIPDAQKYIHSTCAKTLLSINHEAGTFRVIDICQPGKKLKYRFPFWIRNGYVEELYNMI